MPYMIFDVGRSAWRGHVNHLLPLGQKGTRKAACGASPENWSYEGRMRGWLLVNGEKVTCPKCLPFAPTSVLSEGTAPNERSV